MTDTDRRRGSRAGAGGRRRAGPSGRGEGGRRRTRRRRRLGRLRRAEQRLARLRRAAQRRLRRGHPVGPGGHLGRARTGRPRSAPWSSGVGRRGRAAGRRPVPAGGLGAAAPRLPGARASRRCCGWPRRAGCRCPRASRSSRSPRWPTPCWSCCSPATGRWACSTCRSWSRSTGSWWWPRSARALNEDGQARRHGPRRREAPFRLGRRPTWADWAAPRRDGTLLRRYLTSRALGGWTSRTARAGPRPVRRRRSRTWRVPSPNRRTRASSQPEYSAAMVNCAVAVVRSTCAGNRNGTYS